MSLTGLESCHPLLGEILQIAQEAGERILQVYGREDFGEQLKSDSSPLTEADLAAHRHIVQRLQALTPGWPILSEESAAIPWSERQGWQRYWLVDPLDGTKEFIKRNGEFTVNIALIDQHRPILGVVHAPVLATSWLGDVEQGAFKQTGAGVEPIRVQPHQPGEPWRVVGSRSHAGAGLAAFLADLGEHELVSMGSSIKLCLVAEGAAHLYPRLGLTSEWDTAAAQAVVEAAGGEVIQQEDAKALEYNRKESLLNPFFIVRPIVHPGH
ncbi:MAG: 3'(2'),5'-bisphosphate nucleotidase CysQ [Gammaproteobacteria bacterium]|nr:3'(2'),5'-bisphosphate nucleotidase CysQ [Gammaproteobacteria bacterium]